MKKTNRWLYPEKNGKNDLPSLTKPEK